MLLKVSLSLRKATLMWIIISILTMSLGVFALIIFCVQPLAEVHTPRILYIDGQPKYFAFNMTLEGTNRNILDILIEDADLDVLASAGALPRARLK